MESCVSFPDPASGDFDPCRRLLQAACPTGLVLAEVRQTRWDKSKYVWTATYHHVSNEFPRPEDFDVSTAKSILQAMCPSGGSVSTISVETNIAGRTVWSVAYKVKNKKARCLPRLVETCDELFGINKRAETVAALNNAKTSNYVIYIKRKEQKLNVCVSDVQPEDVPMKIFINGLDCTRAAVKKTRFSRATYSAFIAKRRALDDPRHRIAFVPATADVPTSSVEESKLTGVAPPSSVCKDVNLSVNSETPGNSESVENLSNTIQCDGSSGRSSPPPPYVSRATTRQYSQDSSSYNASTCADNQSACSNSSIGQSNYSYNKMCQFVKLRDVRVLKTVKQYLAMMMYEPKGSGFTTCYEYETRRGVSMSELIVRLKTVPLPIGQDLYDLYLDFNCSLNVARSAVVDDIIRYRRSLEM